MLLPVHNGEDQSSLQAHRASAESGATVGCRLVSARAHFLRRCKFSYRDPALSDNSVNLSSFSCCLEISNKGVINRKSGALDKKGPYVGLGLPFFCVSESDQLWIETFGEK